MTLVGTFLTCSLAISIEGAANKTLYYFFPHLYRDVDNAFGLDLHLDRDVLHRPASRQDTLANTSEYVYSFLRDKNHDFAESPLTAAKREWENADKINSWSFS